LGQILYVQDEYQDALECFRRAKGLGYSVPLVTAYSQTLERIEAEGRAAALKRMSPPVGDAQEAVSDTPVAVTESSARTMGVFAAGGVVVGLLLGRMLRRKG
jgi:hypothetical protein